MKPRQFDARPTVRRPVTAALGAILLLISGIAHAAVMQAMKAEPTGNQDVRIAFQFDGAVQPSEPFALEGASPRVIVDFPGAKNGMTTNSVPVGIRFVRELQIIEAAGRTRVIINTSESSSFSTQARGNYVYINLVKRDEFANRAAPELIQSTRGTPASPSAAASPAGAAAPAAVATKPAVNGITDIQFRRGKNNEGRLVISISDPNLPLDVREDKQDQIAIDIPRADIPVDLQRRLDVIDFGTPVQTVDAFKTDNGSRVLINTDGPITHLTYQTGNTYTLEVRRKVGVQEQETEKAIEFNGERLSLNFQDIETRDVLQVIAEFTGLNIVVSDSVSGNVTLRLNDVPWDQALDLVLQSQGLAMRRTGNVILVAPSDELAQQERLELESRTQLTELSPIRSEIFKIRYADVGELFELLSGDEGGGGEEGGEGEGGGGGTGLSLISPRGRIIADERTNTLIIYESAERLADIRDLIDKLDVPVRQVLIESRIVTVTDDYFKSLGVRFGASTASFAGGGEEGVRVLGGGNEGTITPGYNIFRNPAGSGDEASPEALMTSFRAADSPDGFSPGALTMLLGNFPSNLIQLELSALQRDGQSETISTPRVITADQQTASISTGELIPFQEATASGATSTSFQEATLGLEVTPQITPDDNIIMSLLITDDRPAGNNIATSRIETNVRVPNGDTLVLGGVFRETKTDTVNKVPVLGDLPLVGNLFRNKAKQDNKNELLIFITPKILPDLAAK